VSGCSRAARVHERAPRNERRLCGRIAGERANITGLSVAIPLRREGSSSRACVRAILRPRTRSRLWVELLAIAWLIWVYDAITNLAHLRLHTALANARGILHLEQALHIDPELGLDRWLAGHHTLAAVLAEYYDNAHWSVPFVLLAYLWWRRADLYRPLRNSLVLVNVIGFVVFWRYPVAPPRMLSGFTDVVSSTHAFGNFHGGSLASHANEVAAMPSLHMAWAAWCALALWRLSARGWVRALAIAYPCATAFTVLATGNHFVIDLLAGLATLALSLGLLAAPRALTASWRRSAAARRRWLGRLDRGRRELKDRAAAVPPYRAGVSVSHRARTAFQANVETARD
jgi:PAP2 superfamily